MVPAAQSLRDGWTTSTYLHIRYADSTSRSAPFSPEAAHSYQSLNWIWKIGQEEISIPGTLKGSAITGQIYRATISLDGKKLIQQFQLFVTLICQFRMARRVDYDGVAILSHRCDNMSGPLGMENKLGSAVEDLPTATSLFDLPYF